MTRGAGGDTEFDGRSQGEAASEDATDTRLQHAQAGLLRTVGGPVGAAAASALGALDAFGSRATAIGSDLTNQMGVGHISYHPDLTPWPQPHRRQHDRRPTTAATTAPATSRTISCPTTRGRQSPRPTRPRRHQHHPRLNGGGLGGGAGEAAGSGAAAGGRRGCSRRPDRPRLGEEFWFHVDDLSRLQP